MTIESLWDAIIRGGAVHIEDLKRQTRMSKTAILNMLSEFEDDGLVTLEEVDNEEEA